MLAIFSVGAEAASRQRFGRKQHGSFIRSGDPVLDIDTTSLLYHDVPSEILFDTTPQPGTELRLRPRQAGDIFVSDKPGSKGAAVSTTAATDQRPTFSNAATAVPSSNSGGGSSVVTPAPSRTSIPTSGGSSSSPNSVETGIVMQPGSSATDLPKVFEGGFGTNYTESSCPAFLTSMIKNQTFTDCLPFSLLLQNSMSFFAASKSPDPLSRTLDTSCHVNYPLCSAHMSSLALSLKQDSACGADYRRQNPIVRSAYAGLMAYDPLYQVSCFHAQGMPNNEYCFSNAVMNQSAPSDSYVYYLPLGLPIPGGSVLTCSDCLKRTMGMFQEAAGNKSQALNAHYGDAARMVNVGCGPGFVNTTVSTAKGQGSGAQRTVGGGGRALPMAMMMVMMILTTAGTLWL